MDLKEQYNGLEIAEQFALDHFNAILKEAQRAIAEADKKNPQKCPRKYKGNSKRTLKWHRKNQENLSKQGYLSVFDFMAYVKKTTEKRSHLEQLVARASESEQVIELKESAPEELDTEGLVSEHMDQVHCRDLLMH